MQGKDYPWAFIIFPIDDIANLWNFHWETWTCDASFARVGENISFSFARASSFSTRNYLQFITITKEG